MVLLSTAAGQGLFLVSVLAMGTKKLFFEKERNGAQVSYLLLIAVLVLGLR